GDAVRHALAGAFAAVVNVTVSRAVEFHRRARRTGREVRASSGSHCSAAPIQKAPVSEQIGLAAYDVRQPVMRSSLVASEGLELPMHPSCQNAVDVAQGGIERRLVETA